MVKVLSFKGDKKLPKKRKRTDDSEPSTALTTTTSAPVEDDDIWLPVLAPIEIAGPTLLVLPTSTPCCLASDATSAVFASKVDNMVEGNPASAEPHDVRQVWVANRVAGTDKVSFKGTQGRYLACDKFGVLRAEREAVGPEEGFTLHEVEGGGEGRFALKTGRNTFITASGEKERGADSIKVSIRGDAEEVSPETTLILRMQARFKPRHAERKAEKAMEKITKLELEKMAGRTLDESDVKKLKKARKKGDFGEVLLDVRKKGKSDKFA